MQEQEGFDNSDRVELVEFHYKALSIHLQPKKRLTLKTTEGWKATRDSHRGDLATALARQEPQNVVFSPNMNEITMPDNQIQFSADFEGSNLQIVIRRRFLEYQLYLRPDTNTSTHFQWFCFRVKTLKGSKTPTFIIKNFIKAGMLYNSGLRPFYRRGKNQQFQQLQTEVRFYQNVPQDSFCLEFSFQFLETGEEVEFSSQPPYSYTHLINTLTTLDLNYNLLCKSAMGKRVPYLTFHEQKFPKAIVMVIARQHPGQSVGSWMMQGLLKQLKGSNNNGIQWLVVPMMCVDGVILGNNRTGLAGLDYNRFWNIDELSRKEKSLPEIIAFLNLIKHFRKVHARKPKMFLDLHGHSSQSNIFAYGPPHEQNTQMFWLSRIFPELLSRKNVNFSIDQCSYMIKPDKKNTSRSLVLHQYFVPFVYTIQASFGILRGSRAKTQDYLKFGEDLVETAQDFLLNCILGQKPTEAASLIQEIKNRGQQGEVVEFDSDNEQDDESKSQRKRELATTDRGSKYRINSQSPPLMTRKNSEMNAFQLFKVEKQSPNRYIKPKQRKRVNTQVKISKDPKVNFLPRLKETVKKLPTQSTCEKEEVRESLMNIHQIQRRFQRLKNSRIGKKILIINSYGG